MNYIRIIVLSLIFIALSDVVLGQNWFQFLKENPQYNEVLKKKVVQQPVTRPFQSVSASHEIKESYHYDKSTNTFLKKDYCCVRQVKHYLYSYDQEDKITEVFLYRVHEPPKWGKPDDFVDTVWIYREFYTYDDRDRLIEKKKIKYAEDSRELKNEINSKATYSYNWRGLETLHTYQFKLTDPFYHKYYNKRYYDWRGRKRKDEQYVGEVEFVKFVTPVEVSTYEYEGKTKLLSSSISKHSRRGVTRKQYFHSGTKLIKRISHSPKYVRTTENTYSGEMLTIRRTSSVGEDRVSNTKYVFEYVLR